jgi:hypothetical protein
MSTYTDSHKVTKYERFFWRITCILIIGDLLIGLGFLLGLPTSSPSYLAAKSLMSLPSWGIVAIMASIIYLAGIARHNRPLMAIGLSIGSFYTILFAITFIFAYIGGYLIGFTGIVWWLAIGVMHTMAVIALPTSTQIKRLKHDTNTLPS